jgi:heme-degrading protein
MTGVSKGGRLFDGPLRNGFRQSLCSARARAFVQPVRIRNEEKPAFMQFLFHATDHKIFPEGGGALIRSVDGAVVGAVGVTGDTEERDEELAYFGIKAVGLKTDDDCAALGRTVNFRSTK